MTRKDYRAIAGAFALAREERTRNEADLQRRVATYKALDLAANIVADRMAADNERFDRGLFLDAAKVSETRRTTARASI